jgi:IS5 family transposase
MLWLRRYARDWWTTWAQLSHMQLALVQDSALLREGGYRGAHRDRHD